MKPLQPLALGLVVVAITASVHGYDLLANPLGWLLVMVGVRDLPEATEHRSRITTLGWTATVFSVPLWVPVIGRAVADADPGLSWATDLPAVAFAGLLCQSLARMAAGRRDRVPAALFRAGVTANIVVALLPIMVFGAGVSGAAVPADTAFVLTRLAVVALCFLYADREWAMSPARPRSEPGLDGPLTKPPTGP